MKRCQKAGFLSPRSSKITVTKEKERAGRRKGGEEKKAMVALLAFHNSHCWTQLKRSFSLAITLSKMLSYGSQWKAISESPGPLYQNEVKCSAPLIWKWFFILMQMKLICSRLCIWPHFEVRVFGTRKWPIAASSFNFRFCFIKWAMVSQDFVHIGVFLFLYFHLTCTWIYT